MRAGPTRDKERRPGRISAVFKALVLLLLMGGTAYGMLNKGLYGDELWLPVAAAAFALLLVTIFIRGFYEDVPPVGWALVALLGVLVTIKGLSMIWTISEAETVRELLRSSMYLAVFLMPLGALTSSRQVGPLLDTSVLIVVAVAGYGLLQKIEPEGYPVGSLDEVRVDSTLGYANTAAVVIAMGAVLALARMAQMRSPLGRGLYAVFVAGFLAALFLTGSRGGIASLGLGLVVLFALGGGRLQMGANLLFAALPVGWLLWEIRKLDGLLQANVPKAQKAADGVAFRDDLFIAFAVAFALQGAYSLVIRRYELTPLGRRALGAAALVPLLLAIGIGMFALFERYGGVGETYQELVNNPAQTENMGKRLASLSIGYRQSYWEVGWESWKENPLTGTGAGTFQYVWLENRPGDQGVKQVHNLYLEQGVETGVFAFLALLGFCGLLAGYTARAAWRSDPEAERRLLLAGLVAAISIYLISSAIEWHWYIPPSTMFFFILSAFAAKLAAREEWGAVKEPWPQENDSAGARRQG